MRLTYILIAVTALAGCASEPAKQASDPPAAAATVAPVASVAPPVAAAQAEKADLGSSADREFQPPAGYQKKAKGSKTVYCRSDTPVGTRFAKEYCYTQEELERMNESRANIRQEIDRARRTCAGAACSGGG